MVKEEITVKSKDYGEFKYTYEKPETIAEYVSIHGEAQTLEWLQSGHKTDINAKEWAKVKPTKTEEFAVDGKTFRVPKELAAVLRKMEAEKAGAAA